MELAILIKPLKKGRAKLTICGLLAVGFQSLYLDFLLFLRSFYVVSIETSKE